MKIKILTATFQLRLIIIKVYMEVQDWGTTTIYANAGPSSGYKPSEFGSSNSSGGPSGPMTIIRMIQERQVTKIIANGVNVFNAAIRGDVFETINQMLTGFNYLTTDEFRKQLVTFDYMNRGLFHWGASRNLPLMVPPSNLVEVGSTYALMPPQETGGPYSFYGTPLMLGTALHYWVNGHGEDRTVHISSLNVSPSIGNFPAITNAVAANGPGTYPINSAFSVNLFDNASSWYAAVVIGRIAGNVNGTLTINPGGDWSFNGSFTLNRDLFNADHSSRNWVQERMTDTLRLIGDVFGHADYYINIDGAQPIQFSGHK